MLDNQTHRSNNRTYHLDYRTDSSLSKYELELKATCSFKSKVDISGLRYRRVATAIVAQVVRPARPTNRVINSLGQQKKLRIFDRQNNVFIYLKKSFRNTPFLLRGGIRIILQVQLPNQRAERSTKPHSFAIIFQFYPLVIVPHKFIPGIFITVLTPPLFSIYFKFINDRWYKNTLVLSWFSTFFFFLEFVLSLNSDFWMTAEYSHVITAFGC